MRRLAFLIAVGLALVAPASALAQGTTTANPFTPGIPSSPSTPTTNATPTIVPTTTTSTTAGGSLGGGSIAGIGIGALVLLGGISFFIWRDARRRAPVRHRVATATAGESGRPGSKSRGKPRKLSPAERRRRKRGRAR